MLCRKVKKPEHPYNTQSNSSKMSAHFSPAQCQESCSSYVHRQTCKMEEHYQALGEETLPQVQPYGSENQKNVPSTELTLTLALGSSTLPHTVHVHQCAIPGGSREIQQEFTVPMDRRAGAITVDFRYIGPQYATQLRASATVADEELGNDSASYPRSLLAVDKTKRCELLGEGTYIFLKEVQTAAVTNVPVDDASRPRRLGATYMPNKRGISDDPSQPSPKRMKQMPVVHVRPSTKASLDINSDDEAGSLKPQPTNTNGNATESPETTKKGRGNPKITTADFAAIDNMLTGVLIDGVEYWAKIRKNQSYNPPGELEAVEITAEVKADVARIIQENVIAKSDMVTAETALLSIDGIQKFYQALEAPTRKHFRDHLRRYLQIYLTDCPFDINSTHRYNLYREEASITARHYIPQGSTITYLNGAQVDISPEEERSITGDGSYFSIV